MSKNQIPFKHPWVYKDAVTVAGTDYVHVAVRQRNGVNNHVNVPVAYV